MSSKDASDEREKKYSELTKEVERTIKQLQGCDDVDQAVELFERASTYLSLCEAKLEAAKGKFEKMTT